MTTPNETKVYDKDGDLTLCVGSAKTRYQVCPHSLARSSPVFNRMLYGNFAESRPAVGDWVVELPEDDTGAMEVFLGMVHGRFELIPKTLLVAELYALLTLTNKYDATALVRPWAPSWIDGVRYEAQDYRLMGIAWEIGDKTLFSKMMWVIIHHSYPRSDGQLQFCITNHSILPSEPIHPSDGLENNSFTLGSWPYLRPTGVLEMIAATRESLIKTALKPLESLELRLKNADECTATEDSEASTRCDCMGLGSLAMNFAWEGLSIRVFSVDDGFHGSFSRLRQVLESSSIRALHPECEKSITTQLTSGIKEAERVSLPFPDEWTTALSRQAQKTGI